LLLFVSVCTVFRHPFLLSAYLLFGELSILLLRFIEAPGSFAVGMLDQHERQHRAGNVQASQAHGCELRAVDTGVGV
jgi:hypothetical protein